MPEKQSYEKQRNWYKIATIALSAAMVLITFMSGVYYKHIDERETLLNKIENKIDKLHLKQDKLKKIPMVHISVMTLKETGIPESAFDRLSEIPSVIKIQHICGTTAKDITIEVTSESKLLNFIPEASVEKFDYRINNEKNVLRIEVLQLRKGSIVQGTIMCSSISTLEVKSRIDNGTILQNEKKEENVEDLYFTTSALDKIIPTSFTSIEEIDSHIKGLRRLLKRERNKSIFGNISFPSFFNPLMWTYLFLIFGGYWLFMFIKQKVKDNKKAIEGNVLGNKIGRAKQKNLIYLDMAQSEVEQLIGLPHKISFLISNEVEETKWFYLAKYSKKFGWQPDVSITFINGKVISVEYIEYGKRNYI